MYRKVSTDMNFVEREKEVLDFWKRGIRSLMARVSMWPMCGRPLAVGGPSKKVKRSAPSR